MSSIYRIILTVAGLIAAVTAFAQTPVEAVVLKYDNVSGAKSFVAQGLRMDLARRLLASTPVAPIASDVDELAILKMEGTQQGVQKRFVSDLEDALEKYEYYGKFPSKNGPVKVYVHYTSPGKVDELVIYNPEICSLNSLYGDFSAQALEQIARQAQ